MAAMLKLRSSDKEVFEVEEKVIKQSQTIKNMIEDGAATGEIPLRVSSQTLAKVLEWCKEHQQETKKKEDEIKEWENNFCDELSDNKGNYLLCDIITASNYLKIPALLDRLTAKAADMIHGKTPEEIRRTFNIKNDFINEEEKKQS